jgi:hypothetical protein
MSSTLKPRSCTATAALAHLGLSRDGDDGSLLLQETKHHFIVQW